MTEFFHDWRRKAGVVALVMSCMFAVGWIRSLDIQDSIRIHLTVDTYSELVSGCGWLEQTFCNVQGDFMLYGPIWQSSAVTPGNSLHYLTDYNLLSEKRFCGFEYSEYQHRAGIYFSIRRIPYWLLVILLAALSAHLLLGKPRVPKPTSAIEPVPAEAP